MTVTEFNLLVRNFPQIDSSAVASLEAQILKTEYCQTLYVLLARIKQDQQNADASQYLQKAAVRAPDRSHLKKILEQKLNPTIPVAVSEPVLSTVLEKSISEQDSNSPESREVMPNKSTTTTEILFAGSIADEVENDVNILKEKTRQFSALSPWPKKSLDRFLSQQPEHPMPEEKSEKVTTSKGTKGQDETDILLSEIKSNRKKVKPENTKQSEQLTIIDQFIRTNLVTIKPPEKGTRRQDLTESANSYSENVISETLVEILIKQGKNEKAIEVLRKLIWKFPQKKHLFATRIEELSK